MLKKCVHIAEKEIIHEEETITTDRNIPQETIIYDNTNNNNSENSTATKNTETVIPSAENNYTYEEETIVERVYSK